MFGLGKVDGLNRRDYNFRVKECLERHIGIETDNDKNPRFCGPFVFADLIAQGWYASRSAEDTATVIGLMYWEGNAKRGGEDAEEAKRIALPLNEFWISLAVAGKISEGRAVEFREFMDKYCWMMNQPPRRPAASPAEPKRPATGAIPRFEILRRK